MMAIFPMDRKVFVMDKALSCQVSESILHQLSPSTIWALGIKLGSSGLAAKAFTRRAPSSSHSLVIFLVIFLVAVTKYPAEATSGRKNLFWLAV